MLIFGGVNLKANRYRHDGFRAEQGTLIKSFKHEEGTYPDNGVHADGYWYVKGDKATIPVDFILDGKKVEIEEVKYVENGKLIDIECSNVENNKLIKLF